MSARSILLLAAIGFAAFIPHAALAEEADPAARSGLYHLDGISEDVARGDLADCMAASTDALSSRSRLAASNDYGLLGSIMNGLLGSGKTFRLRNASLQKCMILRGYHLFLVDEASWQKILGLSDPLRIKNGIDQSVVIDALATFATKPLPDSPEFHP